mmetsp:Transcript_21981/g.52123  ORF Transcript_21981/g.52123 Transcript_21981/m.52123 type:complete len:113 (+) Transcript_21981:482-820(+)
MTSGLVAQMSSAWGVGMKWGRGWEPASELEWELPPEWVLVSPWELELAPEQALLLPLELVPGPGLVLPFSRSCCRLLPAACHQPSSQHPQHMPTQAVVILECEDLERSVPDG